MSLIKVVLCKLGCRDLFRFLKHRKRFGFPDILALGVIEALNARVCYWFSPLILI